jgi:hypothetical protein
MTGRISDSEMPAYRHKLFLISPTDRSLPYLNYVRDARKD